MPEIEALIPSCLENLKLLHDRKSQRGLRQTAPRHTSRGFLTSLIRRLRPGFLFEHFFQFTVLLSLPDLKRVRASPLL